MSKTKINGLESWELPEGGTDPRAKDLDRWVKERRGDTSVLESATGQAARAKREAAVLGAMGIKPKEEEPEKLKDKQEPFADLKAQLRDLEESLKKKELNIFLLSNLGKNLSRGAMR